MAQERAAAAVLEDSVRVERPFVDPKQVCDVVVRRQPGAVERPELLVARVAEAGVLLARRDRPSLDGNLRPEGQAEMSRLRARVTDRREGARGDRPQWAVAELLAVARRVRRRRRRLGARRAARLALLPALPARARALALCLLRRRRRVVVVELVAARAAKAQAPCGPFFGGACSSSLGRASPPKPRPAAWAVS